MNKRDGNQIIAPFLLRQGLFSDKKLNKTRFKIWKLRNSLKREGKDEIVVNESEMTWLKESCVYVQNYIEYNFYFKKMRGI